MEIGNILEKYAINKNGFDFTMLNVAQHVEPKNIDLIIKPVKVLRDKYSKKVQLINVGNGYLTEYLTNLVKENNLEKQVKFLGIIPNEDVIRLMKCLDIFIQTSNKVIFDLVVLKLFQWELRYLFK